MEQGKIVKVVAGFYDVRSNNDRKIYRVRGGGKLRLLDIIPIVGDYVEFEKNELIHRILGRKNFFIRPRIANVDQAIVVMSLVEPEFSSLLVDKFLIVIEKNKIRFCLFFLFRIFFDKNSAVIAKKEERTWPEMGSAR